MKVEAPSPTLTEEQPPLQEETKRNSLDESDSDADPFPDDFQLPEQSSVIPLIVFRFGRGCTSDI